MGVGMEAASQGTGNNKAELSGQIDSVQIIIFPSPRKKQRSGTTGTRYMERERENGQVRQARSKPSRMAWWSVGT